MSPEERDNLKRQIDRWENLDDRLCKEPGYYKNNHNFDSIAHKKSRKKELHGILLLDELLGADKDGLIMFAANEWIVFEVHTAETDSLTDDQICELIRCSIYPYEEDKELLGMHI